MAYEFNVFSTPLEVTDTVIKFAASGDMTAGYEIWIEGTGLTHDAVTGQFGGTIVAMTLFDLNVGDAVQTITFDGDPLAAVNTFTANAAAAYDATVTLGLFDPPFARLGEPVVSGGGAVVTFALLDGADQLLGYLRATG